MKLVSYRNVDGYNICLGIGEAIVDTMATCKEISEELKASDEAKAITALNAEIAALRSRLKTRRRRSQIVELMKGYPELAAKLDARRSALMTEHAIYFTPGPNGDKLITDDQAAALIAAQGPSVKVRLDGTTIVDFRGTSYWVQAGSRWANTMITKLGDTVPAGAILDAALTDSDKAAIGAQFEADRVAAFGEMLGKVGALPAEKASA